MKKPIEQVIKENYPEFLEEVQGLSVEQIDARLAQMQKDKVEIDKAKEADEKLEAAKATVKELSAPYRDAKKAINQKSEFLVKLAEEKGSK